MRTGITAQGGTERLNRMRTPYHSPRVHVARKTASPSPRTGTRAEPSERAVTDHLLAALMRSMNSSRYSDTLLITVAECPAAAPALMPPLCRSDTWTRTGDGQYE